MNIKIPKWLIIVSFIFLIFLAFLMYLRYIGTSGLVVKEYKVVNKNITENYHGLKIVQLSDIHYKTTINNKDLLKIVDKINYINPDIVVFTGDLFDNKIKYSDNDLKELKNSLNKIKVSYKKYAINGNHDDIDMWKSVISDSGFVDIRDSYDLIYMNDVKPILISGLDQDSDKVNKFLENDNVYSIVIMHEPDKALNVSGYNLMLGGHSHNGQIRLPYIGALYKIEGSKTYYDEHYKIKGNDLFISGGLGCSLLNLRFFNHPSINFYRIVNK